MIALEHMAPKLRIFAGGNKIVILPILQHIGIPRIIVKQWIFHIQMCIRDRLFSRKGF